MWTGIRIVRAWSAIARVDGLADPPRRVRRELEALGVVELVDGAHEAQVPLLDEVQEREPSVAVALGDGDHESQVGLDQDILGLLAPADQAPLATEGPGGQHSVAGASPSPARSWQPAAPLPRGRPRCAWPSLPRARRSRARPCRSPSSTCGSGPRPLPRRSSRSRCCGAWPAWPKPWTPWPARAPAPVECRPLVERRGVDDDHLALDVVDELDARIAYLLDEPLDRLGRELDSVDCVHRSPWVSEPRARPTAKSCTNSAAATPFGRSRAGVTSSPSRSGATRSLIIAPRPVITPPTPSPRATLQPVGGGATGVGIVQLIEPMAHLGDLGGGLRQAGPRRARRHLQLAIAWWVATRTSW